MSAEFYITFCNRDWYTSNRKVLEDKISSLSTFSNRDGPAEFWLTGTEPRRIDCWEYDVRLFLEPQSVFLEISSRPPSVEIDLQVLFLWLRQFTETHVDDEDGEATNW